MVVVTVTSKVTVTFKMPFPTFAMKSDMFIFTTDFPQRRTNLWPSVFICGKKDIRSKTTLPH